MSDIVNKNENLELELDDNTILSNLFGINERSTTIVSMDTRPSIGILNSPTLSFFLFSNKTILLFRVIIKT